jgi:uncharacterized protein YraI
MIRWLRVLGYGVVILGAVTLTFYTPISSSVLAQQPTGSIPTVTGTPQGVVIALYLDRSQESVYAGPSSYLYPPIGVMLAGQEAPAYGKSEDGNWIQIYYPGVPGSVAWVYAPYVSIKKNGDLPIIPPPSTPTPASTPTINPTLAAAFIAPSTPTRLPTYTEPAQPLDIPTFSEESSSASRLPIGLLILGFGFIGGLGVLISFLRGR